MTSTGLGVAQKIEHTSKQPLMFPRTLMEGVAQQDDKDVAGFHYDPFWRRTSRTVSGATTVNKQT
jgi:hypothetical protein